MAALTYADYLKAARSLNCEVAAIRAVADVESSGSGFDMFSNIKKRFEAHLFLRETGQSASSYDTAYQINARAAIRSTSWGKFQVLGSNFKDAGYSSPEAMVANYKKSEQNQLDSFVRLIKAWGLTDELQNRQWAAFARAYNGPRYAENAYHTKMADRYQKYLADPKQDLILGYSQNSVLGSVVLVVLIGGGYYAYQKGYLQKWLKSISNLKLPKIL